MSNIHEDMIKEDEKDLQELTEQANKIEKLKKQFSKQKDQIGSLNNIIHELQNQNKSLRAQGKQEHSEEEESNEYNESDHKDEEFHRKCQIKSQNIKRTNSNGRLNKGKIKNQEKNKSRGQGTQTKLFSKTFSNQKRAHLQQQDPEQCYEEPRAKLWNLKAETLHRKNTVSTCTAGAKFKHTIGLKMLNEDEPSLRNHSGFISSSKLMSPQHRIRNETFRMRSQVQNQNSCSSAQDGIKLNITSISTKTKLINNLISDLQCQLKQCQNQLHYQQSSHNHTKSVLQTTLSQNQSLIQSNNTLLNEFELINKENQYLKKQLIQCMEQKNRIKWELENRGEQARKWKCETVNKNDWEFQQEMRAMDRIYWQFQNLCSLQNNYVRN